MDKLLRNMCKAVAKALATDIPDAEVKRAEAKEVARHPVTPEEEAHWEKTAREWQRLHPGETVTPNGHF